MKVDQKFISECVWLLDNLTAMSGATEYFLELHQWLENLINTGDTSREVLLRIFSATKSRAYENWYHYFKIDVAPYTGWPIAVGERLDSINAAARAYLAELGCTEENDWGKKANPPIE